MTNEEKLSVIEALVDRLRENGARRDPDTFEYDMWHALRAISADIRARMKTAPSRTEHLIATRIEAVKRSNEDRRDGVMIALAYDVIHNWPTLCAALQNMQKIPEEART